jgi:hypothetical protein
MKYIRPEQEHSGEAHTAKPGALSPLRSGGIYPSMHRQWRRGFLDEGDDL